MLVLLFFAEQCQGLRAEMAERNGDLAALRSREAVARQELQAVVSRCRQLEEEAERGKAGQLEQRFNGELVQLKLREAESQLQAERHAKAEAVQLMEEVSRKLHEMETAWEVRDVGHVICFHSLDFDWTSGKLKSSMPNNGGLSDQHLVIA